MKSEQVLVLLVLAALVAWLRRPAPAIPTVATSSQWFDPTTNEWRDF